MDIAVSDTPSAPDPLAGIFDQLARRETRRIEAIRDAEPNPATRNLWQKELDGMERVRNLFRDAQVLAKAARTRGRARAPMDQGERRERE